MKRWKQTITKLLAGIGLFFFFIPVSVLGEELPMTSVEISKKVMEKTENLVYGILAWVAVGCVLIVTALLVLLRRSARKNRTTSAQYYGFQRESRKHPKRLLEEKYYSSLGQNNRRKE